MKKYYINGQVNESDALSFEELKSKGLKASDFVWFEGLDDWKPATQIEEMASLIKVQDENLDKKMSTSEIFFVGLMSIPSICLLIFLFPYIIIFYEILLYPLSHSASKYPWLKNTFDFIGFSNPVYMSYKGIWLLFSIAFALQQMVNLILKTPENHKK